MSIFQRMQISHEFEVRPFRGEAEYERMLDYFYQADHASLTKMGVDQMKLPIRKKWLEDLLVDHERSDHKRDRFYLAWLCEGHHVGHSNINKISYGLEASIHLHLWSSAARASGLGAEFFRRSCNFFIERFHLKKLICEPWAENPAPNKVLQKLGFKHVRQYKTTPGRINYEQIVNRYEIEHRVEAL